MTFDLAKLRTARGVPQKVIAATLELNASGVSRYEGARNPRINTLSDYVTALGGELVLTAVFPDVHGRTQKYLVRPPKQRGVE